MRYAPGETIARAGRSSLLRHRLTGAISVLLRRLARQSGKPASGRVPHHILVLNWRDPWHPEAGGAEVMLYEHVRRWHEQGHAITVFTATYPGAADEETRDGIRIVRRGGRFSLYLWAPLLYLRRFRREVDAILDIENGIPFFTPMYSRKPKVCLVHHVHRQQFLWEFGPVIGRVGVFLECGLMPLLYRRVPFVAVSESTRRELVKIGIPARRIGLAHNGLDHEAYQPVVSRSGIPRLVYVGRLKRHKRVDLLIELVARLREEVPGLTLDIVGRGDDEDRLRALVAERGLSEAIWFHGFVSHVRKVAFYSHAWALVTATEREGWGLSITEAAACGTPTLCLDAPGVRDAVANGMSGVLARDFDELLAATRRFLHNEAWRQMLSLGARQRSNLFSWASSAALLREELIRSWQRSHAIPYRAEVQPSVRVSLLFDTSNVPAAVSAPLAQTVQTRLRREDTVAVREEGIHVEVGITREGDVDAVTRRLRQVLHRAAAQAAAEPYRLGVAAASA